MNLYTVWNNYTDELVILDGTRRQCAEAMGVKLENFYSVISKSTKGKVNKWAVEKQISVKGWGKKAVSE